MDLVGIELLGDAREDDGGVGYGAKVGVSRDAQLGKGSRQADLLDESGERVDAGKGCRLIVRLVYAPDLAAKAGEALGRALVDVAIEVRVVLQHVALKAGELADL